ncbi:hypothetical protein BKP45_04975 [Anaerobacillus alkalidiazotrophicus]|uniref:IrrE N-terminal-like domain-containing protein n=1 Tax=Anaerobacillus alkalidiazotrophicus TaxID=472963 RepID=A0A1S2MC62_9BACI|nr:ImmA/IrrE family metallo-endopeptidase [Anaerobacillus alkalidiazotrophicus]OIJ22033.1 hypothetical protein BKP45_04975 [Anaerobacillus alkalidiazotrophicus]
MRIKETITKLLKKHKTNDPFVIAAEKNIIVSYADLGDTYGFFTHASRIKFININNKLDDTMQRFVCAHELGHAILHPRANTPFLKKNTFYSIDKIEVEANTFAVELLLPDYEIDNFRDTNMTIKEVAGIYGVPGEVCELKTYIKN